MASSSQESDNPTIYNVVHCGTKEKHKIVASNFSEEYKCGIRSQFSLQSYLGLKSSNA